MARILREAPKEKQLYIIKPVDFIYIKFQPLTLVDTKYRSKLIRAKVLEITLSRGNIQNSEGNVSNLDEKIVEENEEFLLALPNWVIERTSDPNINTVTIYNKGFKKTKDYTGWDLKINIEKQETLE